MLLIFFFSLLQNFSIVFLFIGLPQPILFQSRFKTKTAISSIHFSFLCFCFFFFFFCLTFDFLILILFSTFLFLPTFPLCDSHLNNETHRSPHPKQTQECPTTECPGQTLIPRWFQRHLPPKFSFCFLFFFFFFLYLPPTCFALILERFGLSSRWQKIPVFLFFFLLFGNSLATAADAANWILKQQNGISQGNFI